MNGKNLLKIGKEFVTKNSSILLASLAGVSAVSAVLLAIKDTPKVNQMVNNATEEKGEDLNKKETAVIYVKGYWKTILLTTTTLLLIAGNTYIDGRKYAALAGAYALTDGKLKDLKASIKETLGVEDQKKVEDKATEKEMERKEFYPPVVADRSLVGLDPVWDDWLGRIIWTTREQIERACLICNQKILRDDICPLETFYDELGVEVGMETSMFGWNNSTRWYSSSNDREIVKAELDAMYSDYDSEAKGKLCGILRFVNEPIYRFEYYD